MFRKPTEARCSFPAPARQRERVLPRAACGLAAVLAAAPLTAQEIPPQKIALPGNALAVETAGELVVVGLGLNGVAWLDASQPDESLTIRKDWPTASVGFIEGRTFVLGGRGGTTRVVRFSETGAPEVLVEWEKDSPSFAVDARGDMLATGDGGGGVSIWMFEDGDYTQEPWLVSRYPFVGFAKHLAWAPDHTLFVADSQERGALLLDLSDPVRPRALDNILMRGYADSVTVSPGGRPVFTNRIFGTFLLDPEIWPDLEIEDRITPLDPEFHRSESATFIDGTLVVSESGAGVRTFRQDAGGSWQPGAVITGPVNALGAAALPGGRIAIADHEFAVWIAPLPAPAAGSSAP